MGFVVGLDIVRDVVVEQVDVRHNVRILGFLARIIGHDEFHFAGTEIQFIGAHLAVFKIPDHIRIFQTHLFGIAAPHEEHEHEKNHDRNAHIDEQIP